MSPPTTARQWIVAKKPTGQVHLSGPDATFALEPTPLPALSPNQLLLQPLYLSNDPAQRPWIQAGTDPERAYTPPAKQGQPMRAFGVIAKVVTSTSGNFAEGDLVSGMLEWTEYTVVDATSVQKLPEVAGIPTTAFLGALGGTGLTAYFGLLEVGHCKASDVVVVSGAAGATGQMVVQIAKKMIGCKKVVGIAGSAEKCKTVESLGADVCVNYKDADFDSQLKKATDEFADLYFDNVGGKILDAMLTRVKREGRIVACGAISAYNDQSAGAIHNWFEIISNRIAVKGFIVTDHLARAAIAREELVAAFKAGKIQISGDQETVVDTKFEDIPKTWVMLFAGGNTGKLVTKIV
ncbi:NAD(P)-binding protein [Eremomyces bilateralis CBS 781.70]|uniref:NAD(P)-binding protein n=1 Tax=Eremomyces bilateralis CBS 781.70 TaxID=1392243 RepID=A0A6G1G9W2_9PEZI|nr:NAD(P)-binding protein [Eremomyces bilateralis CBS 781.70]KAF1814649.1 NAD(P)-binding protein [Eremomyces bilateralis CBS 781.70]